MFAYHVLNFTTQRRTPRGTRLTAEKRNMVQYTCAECTPSRVIFIACTSICNPQGQLSKLIGYVRAQQTLPASCTKSQSHCESLHSTLIAALCIAAKLHYTFRTCTCSMRYTLSNAKQADFYLSDPCTYLQILHVALCNY